MDILPTYLIKSITADDIDEMETLGIYELLKKTSPSAEFVDVSKHDIREIVREGLELIRLS